MYNTDTLEKRAKHGSYGLPAKGWKLAGVDDLGKDKKFHQLCEYCEKELVRYVHELEHPSGNFPELQVGCVCSGKLTGDPLHAEKRDAAARRLSARRANWLGLTGWRRSRNGTIFLRKDEMIFTLKEGKFGGFSGSYKDKFEVWHRLEGWRELDEAKMALFDAAYTSQKNTNEGELA